MSFCLSFSQDILFAGLAVGLIGLAGCQRTGTAAPMSPGAPASPESRLKLPGLEPCHALAKIPMSVPEEDERWLGAVERCRATMEHRRKEIMRLFHAGDCDGLSALPALALRRGELLLIAELLDNLGDRRARTMFVDLFPGDADDLIEREMRRQSSLLGFDEGCAPAFCRTGKEPACMPWFGSVAPGQCISVRYGSREGCMPTYCSEEHEYLVIAAHQQWSGAAAALVKALADADGYVYGYLCHCGLRGAGSRPREWWESHASGKQQLQIIDDCFAETPGNTVTACWELKEERPARKCGQPSERSP